MINARIQHIDQAIKRGCKPDDEIFHGAGPVSIAKVAFTGYFNGLGGPTTSDPHHPQEGDLYVLINDPESTDEAKTDPTYCMRKAKFYANRVAQRQYLAWALGLIDISGNIDSNVISLTGDLSSYFNGRWEGRPWEIKRIYNPIDLATFSESVNGAMDIYTEQRLATHMSNFEKYRQETLHSFTSLVSLSGIKDEKFQKKLFEASQRKGTLISLNREYLKQTGHVFIDGDNPRDDYIIRPRVGYKAIVGIHFLSKEDHKDYNELIERFNSSNT